MPKNLKKVLLPANDMLIIATSQLYFISYYEPESPY